MRIALAQINPTLGAFAQNARKIIDFSRRAREKRADIAVFSELALFGYPPNDLLERPEVVARQISELKKISTALPAGLTAIFGAVIENPNAKKGGKSYQNVAVVAQKGKKPRFFAKQFLPTYDVFDEARFFEPGVETGIVKIPGVGRVAVTVCEDMWGGIVEAGHKIYPCDALTGIKAKSVDLVVNISASPFSKAKLTERIHEARGHAKRMKVPFAYVNQVCGQDELIFDGRSFFLDEKGSLMVQAATCEEDLVIVDFDTHRTEYRPPEESSFEILRKAIVLGLRDFVHKTGMKTVHLGLSGGIDSALVATLAVDALGPAHVTGVMLPGPYSSRGSVEDSEKLAANLGIKTEKVDINNLYSLLKDTVSVFQKGRGDGSAQSTGEVSTLEQNLQARLRGIILMAYSNATGSLLLTTSNKDELSVGYATLYGDLCGGLMPIGDLLKGEIYELAKHYNREREIIPQAIIDKAPSAELAPDQVDQDSLPPYNVMDKAVCRIVEERKAPSGKIENWLVKELVKSEFKRWQAPPILRVSHHGFGRGRRIPIAQQAYR